MDPCLALLLNQTTFLRMCRDSPADIDTMAHVISIAQLERVVTVLTLFASGARACGSYNGRKAVARCKHACF